MQIFGHFTMINCVFTIKIVTLHYKYAGQLLSCYYKYSDALT